VIEKGQEVETTNAKDFRSTEMGWQAGVMLTLFNGARARG